MKIDRKLGLGPVLAGLGFISAVSLGQGAIAQVVAQFGSELAQRSAPVSVMNDTVLFSQTPDYAVRVFNQDGRPQINLFNKATGRAELSGATVFPQPTPEGMTYTYSGTGIEPSVVVHLAHSGSQTLEVNGVAQAGELFNGTVTYLPAMALPPNAIIQVTLEDVSRAGAPAIALASQTLVLGDRQVPVPFELMYDPTQIEPRFTYALRARITVNGELQFISTTHTPVITRDNPTTQVEILVDPIGRN
jgi:uncharacterized lipoprotein YbaY